MKKRILFLTFLSLVQFLLVHFFLLQRFVNSGDEQALIFQAKMFSQGRLYLDDPIYDPKNPLHKFVAADAMDDSAGRRFSKYDPGWPALMAPGAWLHLEWLVAPLLGAFTVFLLLSEVRKRIGDEFVLVAWGLIALCSFFSLSVANFGTHTATMVCLLSAFILYESTSGDRPSGHPWWRLVGVGLLLAYCSLVRYLDWIPLLTWIAFDLLRRRKIKEFIPLLLGLGFMAPCHLFYNRILTGNAFIPPFVHDVNNTGTSLALSWTAFPTTGIRIWRTLFALPPVGLLLFALMKLRLSGRMKTYLVIFGLHVGLYFFFPWSPAGPGPRYYFPYFPFLILAIVEWHRVNRDQGSAKIGWRVAMAGLVVCSFVWGWGQTLEIYRRRDLERMVATIPETKRIILLQSGTYKMEIPDLIRNPPDLWSADTLYFAFGDSDGAGIEPLLKRFPNHRVYTYRYPGTLQPWNGS